jgi:hypothetical protein
MSRHIGLLAIAIGIVSFLPVFAADQEKKTPPHTELPKELQPSTVTMHGKDIPLSKVLAEVTKQTGNPVDDGRMEKEDVKLKLDLEKVNFWQAIDAIAKTADLKVSVYERNGRIALRDGPYQLLPISYSGIFRVTVKRIDVVKILDADRHMCHVYVEVAWEPRFQPLLMETRPADLVVQDDKGRNVGLPEGGTGPAPVGRRLATEFPIMLEAPHRSASKLKTFKGRLAVMGPTKMLTFTFDKLRPIRKAADALKQTVDGVSVTVRQLMSEGEGGDQLWTVTLLLEYPATGPRFESFQSWVVNNEIFLEKEKDGIKQQFPYINYETDDQSEDKAIIKYRFADEPEKKLLLGKFGDWKLVYRTPGRIAEMPIPFEFKDLDLP